MKRKLLLILVLAILLIVGCENKISTNCIDPDSINLSPSKIQAWLSKNKVTVPEELAAQLDIPEYVIRVLASAKDGIDMSIGINYNVTIKFIQAIQQAAGYYFEDGIQKTIILCK